MQGLERLGWVRGDPGEADEPPADALVARITGHARGLYHVTTIVRDEWLEATAEVTGRLLHAAQGDPVALPVVGDWVRCRRNQGGPWGIVGVLPRRTVLARTSAGGDGVQPLAANVDVVLVVEALGRPLNARRIERVVAAAWGSGAEPVVVLTKLDQCDDPQSAAAVAEAAAPGVQVCLVSATDGIGLEQVAAQLPVGRTGVLVGPSGAGKSTLTNALLGAPVQAVGAVRAADGKGRHTTTQRELLVLPGGGLLIDTPGVREFGVAGTDAQPGGAYGDVEDLAAHCRFRDCRHEGEPGCAVADAVERGVLDAARVEGYLKLARESAYHVRRGDPRATREHERAIARLHAEVLRDSRRFKR